MTIRKTVLLPLLVVLILASAQADDKPKLTLDEFFSYVAFSGVKLSPDGHSVVIATRPRRLGAEHLPQRSVAIP
jgi:hypothetical protein